MWSIISLLYVTKLVSITFNVIFHDVILSLQVLYKHLTNGSWQMQLTSHTCSEYHSLLDFYWKPRLYNFIDQPYIQTLAGLSNSFLTFFITIDLSQFLVLTSSISNWRPYCYCFVSFPLLLLFFFFEVPIKTLQWFRWNLQIFLAQNL